MAGPAPTSDKLYAALDELRRASDLSLPRHHAAWRVVTAFLQQIDPRGEADARQETLVKVLRRIGTFAGGSPGEAVRWLRTVHAHKARDLWRAGRHDPVRAALLDDKQRAADEPPAVDRLRAEDDAGPHDDAAALEQARDALFTRLEERLTATALASTTRELRRVQARAAWLRLVTTADATAIEQAIAPSAANTRDALYKWIERGRTQLLEVLDAWLAELGGDADPDDRRVPQTLRDIFGERRADAGVPRPERRKD